MFKEFKQKMSLQKADVGQCWNHKPIPVAFMESLEYQQ